MSTELVMPSNHLIHCHPLLLLPSIFPSIRVFSSELARCIRWPKYWSFSFSISPPNILCWFLLGLTGLISLLSNGLSRVVSSTIIWKQQFFGPQPPDTLRRMFYVLLSLFLWNNFQKWTKHVPGFTSWKILPKCLPEKWYQCQFSLALWEPAWFSKPLHWASSICLIFSNLMWERSVSLFL